MAMSFSLYKKEASGKEASCCWLVSDIEELSAACRGFFDGGLSVVYAHGHTDSEVRSLMTLAIRDKNLHSLQIVFLLQDVVTVFSFCRQYEVKA